MATQRRENTVPGKSSSASWRRKLAALPPARDHYSSLFCLAHWALCRDSELSYRRVKLIQPLWVRSSPVKQLAFVFLAVLIAATLIVTAPAMAQQISGDYIETRSADVYTGQCFANGEVGLTGNEAILGWRVHHGAWNGVQLDGLSIAAAVRANSTLGDPYGNPYPAKAVLI